MGNTAAADTREGRATGRLLMHPYAAIGCGPDYDALVLQPGCTDVNFI